MEKLKPSVGKRILISSIAFIVGAIILFLCCFSLFTKFPWSLACYIIIAGYVVLGIFFTVFYFLFFYYVIDKDFFVVRKMTKVLFFNYKDIIYIDQNRKSSKSTIGFYTSKGHCIYLTPDKNDVLYNTLLEKCPNLLNEKEFKNKYPNIDL